MKNVLGIFRAACYSPGMKKHDESILHAVAERLKEEGYVVSLIHEEELDTTIPKPDIVLHMARSPQAIDILQNWQVTGCRVINTAESVRHVERAALAYLCSEQGISTPQTWIVDTAHSHTTTAQNTCGTTTPITFPCWIKRTGTCAQHPDDVCRIDDLEAYAQCLTRFRARGISKAVVMQHIEGPCIKFYAVKGSNFFFCLPAYDKWSASSPVSSPPSSRGYSAYETAIRHSILIPINQAKDTPIIYGGDVIIGSDGVAYLIDLNDWPSFSPCREKAAEAITRMILDLDNTATAQPAWDC